MARDGERVFVVALRPPASSASFGCASSRHFPDVEARRRQPLGDVPPMPGGALNADAYDVEWESGQPGQSLLEAWARIGETADGDVDAEYVDDTYRHGGLMRIYPGDRCGQHSLLYPRCDDGMTRRDQRGNAGFSRAGSFQASARSRRVCDLPGRSDSRHARTASGTEGQGKPRGS